MFIRTKHFGIKRKIKEAIKAVCSFGKHYREVCQYEQNAVILWGMPEYGNLGDQAIAYAEMRFINRQLPGIQIVPIPENKCVEYILPLKLLERRKRFTFVLPGGGNMGTLYPYPESRRQMLLRNITRSRIISFPQSTDFVPGSKQHLAAQRVYRKNPHLSLFARERASYEKMRELFPDSKVFLVPDIVASLDMRLPGDEYRKGKVVCCLRSDKESNPKTKEALKEIINSIGQENCTFMDTSDERFARGFDGQAEQIENFWKKMREAKLVITDRLHGMIFSMINDVPCLALDNSTKKISAFYHSWLEDDKAIRLYSNLEEQKGFIYDCLHGNLHENAYIDLSDKFDLLARELTGG